MSDTWTKGNIAEAKKEDWRTIQEATKSGVSGGKRRVSMDSDVAL